MSSKVLYSKFRSGTKCTHVLVKHLSQLTHIPREGDKLSPNTKGEETSGSVANQITLNTFKKRASVWTWIGLFGLWWFVGLHLSLQPSLNKCQEKEKQTLDPKELPVCTECRSLLSCKESVPAVSGGRGFPSGTRKLLFSWPLWNNLHLDLILLWPSLNILLSPSAPQKANPQLPLQPPPPPFSLAPPLFPQSRFLGKGVWSLVACWLKV